MKYIYFLKSLTIYLTLFFLIYFIWFRFFRVNVVFFASLECALIATAFFSIFVINTSLLNNFEKFNLIFISILIGYVVAISVPTIIDRSLSFYILEKIQQRGGGIQLNKFEYIFTNEYVREHDLVNIRLTEQEESGTIVLKGNCVILTQKGQLLATFSKFFRENFLPRIRLLRGEYTDKLLHPFDRSDEDPNYKCN